MPIDPTLPSPNIIKKLQTIDSEAANWVMDRAEELSANTRPTPITTTPKWKLYLIGVSSVFGGPAPSKQLSKTFSSAQNTLAQSWAQTSECIRAAILDYMDRNNITAQDLKLTQEERDSLIIHDKKRFSEIAPLSEL